MDEESLLHKLTFLIENFKCYNELANYLFYGKQRVKDKVLKWFDEIGAKYPAEHNVGHVYEADDNLKKFYKKLDPCNIFNPGIGKTSKTINKPDGKIKEFNIT